MPDRTAAVQGQFAGDDAGANPDRSTRCRSPSSRQSAVPADVEAIVRKCLHKHPRCRYDSARELADDLRRADTGRPVQARAANFIVRGVKWSRRNPMAFVAVAAVLLGLIGMLWVRHSSEKEVDTIRREMMRTRQRNGMLSEASHTRRVYPTSPPSPQGRREYRVLSTRYSVFRLSPQGPRVNGTSTNCDFGDIVMRRIELLCVLVLIPFVPVSGRAADTLAERLRKVEVKQFAKAPGYSEGPTWRNGELFFCSGGPAARATRTAASRSISTSTRPAPSCAATGTCSSATTSTRRCSTCRRTASLSVIADQFDGKPLRSLNDLTVDARGNVYWTDPEGSSLKNPVGSIFRVTPGRRRQHRSPPGWRSPTASTSIRRASSST